MQGRLGIYDKFSPHGQSLDSTVSGVQNQDVRLKHQGGSTQQERMIADKRRSLQRALFYSYQGANVRKEVENDRADVVRALINPNKLKQDYDDKIISIFYDHRYAPGDVFEWVGTNTYWLIYLQDLTELAYFRGDIRKCSHEIAWEDEDGLHKTYAAIRGPVETKINYIQKHEISVDTPNYSLNILLPKTDATVKQFQRYSKFYLQGDKDYNICWRVEAVDWLSMPGILEINATEYYRNETEDDLNNGIVGSLITKPIDPNEGETQEIIGETFIKPKKNYIYSIDSSVYGQWYVSDKRFPIIMEPFEYENGKNSIRIKWNSSYSGQFDLWFGDADGPLLDYKKTIVVESLF